MNFFRDLFKPKHHRKIVLKNSSGIEVTVDISSTSKEAVLIIANKFNISKPTTNTYNATDNVWNEFNKILNDLGKYK